MSTKEYRGAWYQKNKESEKARLAVSNKARRLRQQKWIRQLKESTPCMDCGLVYPYYVMDFDHITDDKVDNISYMLRIGAADSKIQKEIDKCEIVCSNCHRQRTWERAH